MTDAPEGPAEGEPERGSRRSPRTGDSGSPVGSTLSIVLAVIAVIAGFLILRAITNDDESGGVTGGTTPTEATTAGTDTGGTAVSRQHRHHQRADDAGAGQDRRHRLGRQRQRRGRLGGGDVDGPADRRLHDGHAGQQHDRHRPQHVDRVLRHR